MITPSTPTPRWEDVLPRNMQGDLQAELQQLWQRRAVTLAQTESRVRRAVQSLGGTGLDLEGRLWAAYHVLGTTPLLALGNRWGLVIFSASRGDTASIARASRLTAEAGMRLGCQDTRMLVTNQWSALRLERGRYLVAKTTLSPVDTLASLVILAETPTEVLP